MFTKNIMRDLVGSRNVFQIFSIRSVLDVVVRILLGIMEGKEKGWQFPQYIDYKDPQLLKKIQGIVKRSQNF